MEDVTAQPPTAPETEVVEDLAPLPPPREPPSPVFRDAIEAFTVAIILALMIKQFAVEAYKVPTGSMEPVIHGAEVGGDRILINKLVARVRGPRRWEVWVFHYPNNQRINYIKRVVGLPNEALWIMGGDIYTGPYGTAETWGKGIEIQVKRKPRGVQDAIFDRYPQIAAEHVSGLDQETFQRYWIVPPAALSGGEAEWTFDDGVVGRARGRSIVSFRDRVYDVRDKFQGFGPTNVPSDNVVGDVRLTMRVRPREPGGLLVFAMKDPAHDMPIDCVVPVEGEESGGTLAVGDQHTRTLDGVHLPQGRWSDVVITNVDDVLTLEVDGDELARIEYTHALPTFQHRFGRRQSISFGVEGAAIEFDGIRLDRDIYYQPGTQWFIDIPDGHYYVLGDNTAASKDSREWQVVEIEPPSLGGRRIRGDSEAILDIDDLETRVDNPWIARGENGDSTAQRVFFMDEYGNTHDLGQGSIMDCCGWMVRKQSPLVAEDLLMGRAFAVFLPLGRMTLVK